MRVERIVPILRVMDLERALEFYCGRLGFALEWRNGGYAGVVREGTAIRLSTLRGDGQPGSRVYFETDDVDAWYEELKRKGVFPARPDPEALARDPVHQQPTDQTWGMRELYLSDPDGNGLCLASKVRARA